MSKKKEKEFEPIFIQMMETIQNATTMRSDLIRRLTGSNERDLDHMLKYPDKIELKEYQTAFERYDIAERCVRLYADGCWAVSPEVYEVEDDTETPFEKGWRELTEKHSLYHYLHRADILSGIGYYGVLLYGIGDGRKLSEPVRGFDLKEKEPNKKEQELLFVRPFQNAAVSIASWDKNPSSHRYQLPEFYHVKFMTADVGSETVDSSFGSTETVHWTRIQHICPNPEGSEIFGRPWLRPVYNRILDMRKLLGGSAEMYWAGAFPGYAFEVNPEYAAAAGLFETEAGEAFREKVRAQFAEYSNKLQRYLAGVGVTVKSLAPQVESPEAHIDAQLRAIAITMDCPYRIFLGSEEGKLASSQDLRHWNRKLKARHHLYLTPRLVKPVAQRLVLLGAVPPTKEDISTIKVHWPDLDTLTEQDKADVADKRTTAIQKYKASQMESLIPPKEYFTMICGMTPAEADKIVKAMEEYRPKLMERQKEQMEMQADMAIKVGAAGGGGADNARPDKTGGQNPRNPAKDRSRSGGGASGSK